MAGAWEQKASNSVLAYTLHTDLTSIAWAVGLKNLRVPGPHIFLSGMPFDHARNQAVAFCLQNGFEWLLSIDSDTIPPPDGVMRLLAHRQPIVSGLYCRRSPPAGVPVMLKNGVWLTEFPPNGLIEVDLVGAGFLLTHRSVFERVPPQRPQAGKTAYDWRVDMRGLPGVPDNSCLSEDFTWNQHVRAHGYKILVDTSVVCRHAGLSQATYGKMEPLEVGSCFAA